MDADMNRMTSPEDEDLLVRLGAIARVVDPAPDIVHGLGRAALGLRLLDAELATLVTDSALERTSVRGPDLDTRLLAFELGELTIEVQVSVQHGRWSLIGQVVPEPGNADASIMVESIDGDRIPATTVDALGRFAVADVPQGLVRLRLHRPDSPTVVTTWVKP